MIGNAFEGYRIRRLVGTGGMGSVYEAVNEETGDRAAVKIVTSSALSSSGVLKARLLREASASSGIDSPHVTRVLRVGDDPISGFSYLIMELLDGEDLQQILDRGLPLAEDAALRVVAQACLGLHKAHEARVVHRDIKPANLFLARAPDGEVIVKILDFGIAKVKMDEALGQVGALTRTGSLLGSPLYMSPEQALGKKTIDHRTDIWSLGVVLYHALAGRTPFHEIDALGELIVALSQRPAPPLQNFAPWVRAPIVAIVHKALAIDPAERFPTASAMFQALRPLLPSGYGLTQDMALTIGPVERATFATRLILPDDPSSVDIMDARIAARAQSAASVSTTTNHGLANSQADAPKRSSKRAVILGAALATVFGGGVALFGFTRTSPPAPGATLPSDPTSSADVTPPVPSAVVAPEASGSSAGVEPSSPASAASPPTSMPSLRPSAQSIGAKAPGVPSARPLAVPSSDPPKGPGSVDAPFGGRK